MVSMVLSEFGIDDDSMSNGVNRENKKEKDFSGRCVMKSQYQKSVELSRRVGIFGRDF